MIEMYRLAIPSGGIDEDRDALWLTRDQAEALFSELFDILTKKPSDEDTEGACE